MIVDYRKEAPRAESRTSFKSSRSFYGHIPNSIASMYEKLLESGKNYRKCYF